MDRAQTTIRLTLRMSDGLAKEIRNVAQERGIPLNQLIITAVSQWVKSRRVVLRNS